MDTRKLTPPQQELLRELLHVDRHVVVVADGVERAGWGRYPLLEVRQMYVYDPALNFRVRDLPEKGRTGATWGTAQSLIRDRLLEPFSPPDDRPARAGDAHLIEYLAGAKHSPSIQRDRTYEAEYRLPLRYFQTLAAELEAERRALIGEQFDPESQRLILRSQIADLEHRLHVLRPRVEAEKVLAALGPDGKPAS